MSAKGKGSLTMMMVRRAMASFLARMLAEISLESVGMSASTQFEKGKNFLHLTLLPRPGNVKTGTNISS